MALEPDGRPVVGVAVGNPSALDVARLTINGAFDTTFGIAGHATAITADGAFTPRSLMIEPSGKLLLGGYASTHDLVLRLTADGSSSPVPNASLDPTWGTGGVVTLGTRSAAPTVIEPAANRKTIAVAHDGARRLFGDPVTLSVRTAGAGGGSVTSAPAGIDCSKSCSAGFDEGASVQLAATPASGSVFSGWSAPGCPGNGPCTVTLSGDVAITATFEVASPPPVKPPVARINRGPRGTVRTAGARKKVTFRFAANRAGVRFSCRLDKHRFRSCRSPKRFTVRPGKHVFAVRAADAHGVGPIAKRTFTVKRRGHLT
jgi:hypothetical protein